MEFGSMLKKTRKQAEMSQEDMAFELHMSISNISRIETGKYELKATDLFKWINATGSQDVLAALILSVDVTVVQQILDAGLGVLGTIILGGII